MSMRDQFADDQVAEHDTCNRTQAFMTLQQDRYESRNKKKKHNKENQENKEETGGKLDFETYKKSCNEFKTIMVQNKKQEKPQIEDECSICLQLMVDPCKLKCDHRFCLQCLNQLMPKQDSCPLCRVEIAEQFPFVIDEPYQQALRVRYKETFNMRQEELKDQQTLKR